MSSSLYGEGFKTLVNPSRSSALTIKAMLIKNTGYTFSKNHDGVNDLSGGECDATNYIRKSATVTVSWDSSNSRVEFVIDDITWSSLGGASNNTLDALVLYIENNAGDDSLNIPLAYIEFSSSQVTDGQNFVADFNGTDGNIRLTVS